MHVSLHESAQAVWTPLHAGSKRPTFSSMRRLNASVTDLTARSTPANLVRAFPESREQPPGQWKCLQGSCSDRSPHGTWHEKGHNLWWQGAVCPCLSHVDRRASRRFVVQLLSIVTVSLAANPDQQWRHKGSEWTRRSEDPVASLCQAPLTPAWKPARWYGAARARAPGLMLVYLPRIVLALATRGPWSLWHHSGMAHPERCLPPLRSARGYSLDEFTGLMALAPPHAGRSLSVKRGSEVGGCWAPQSFTLRPAWPAQMSHSEQ